MLNYPAQLLLKSDVTIDGFTYAQTKILFVFAEIAYERKRTITITAENEGVHLPTSKHYKGLAYDFRSHDMTVREKHEIVRIAQERLGPKFYVFLEAEGTPNEHIHAQVAKGATFP